MLRLIKMSDAAGYLNTGQAARLLGADNTVVRYVFEALKYEYMQAPVDASYIELGLIGFLNPAENFACVSPAGNYLAGEFLIRKELLEVVAPLCHARISPGHIDSFGIDSGATRQMKIAYMALKSLRPVLEPLAKPEVAKPKDAPAVEPKTEEPKTEEPKTEEPKTEEPKTDEPKTETIVSAIRWKTFASNYAAALRYCEPAYLNRKTDDEELSILGVPVAVSGLRFDWAADGRILLTFSSEIEKQIETIASFAYTDIRQKTAAKTAVKKPGATKTVQTQANASQWQDLAAVLPQTGFSVTITQRITVQLAPYFRLPMKKPTESPLARGKYSIDIGLGGQKYTLKLPAADLRQKTPEGIEISPEGVVAIEKFHSDIFPPKGPHTAKAGKAAKRSSTGPTPD